MKRRQEINLVNELEGYCSNLGKRDDEGMVQGSRNGSDEKRSDSGHVFEDRAE